MSRAGFLSSLTAVAVGLLAGFFIMLAANPQQSLSGFAAILTGGFSGPRNAGQVLYYAAPVIMTGLSVGLAGKAGLFNIGAPGQFITGAFCAVYVGVKCSFLPGGLHCAAALAAAAAAGALWGAIPGALKAWRNVNEVISCIMTNYIGMYLVNHLIATTVFDARHNRTLPVPGSANLPKLYPVFRDGDGVSGVNSGIIIAVASAVLLYLMLEKTVFGYQLRACGLNRQAALHAGIDDKRCILASMSMAGALAGLGGALVYLSGSGTGINVVNTLAAEGFRGIPAALLAFNSPIGVIFTGLLLSHLTVGGFHLQLYDFTPEIIEIIVAVIIYFAAFSALIKELIIRVRIKRRE